MNGFLPINNKDMRERGWDAPDFVYVTGDAYVDHPSFGTAIISRVLEAAGFRVAILAQPDYKSADAFREFGRPRLGFLVSAGNIDSMVAHYTAAKKKRTYDYYSPGGRAGLRPDRATIVYCNRIREAYGDVPTSGILRRRAFAPMSTGACLRGLPHHRESVTFRRTRPLTRRCRWRKGSSSPFPSLTKRLTLALAE